LNRISGDEHLPRKKTKLAQEGGSAEGEKPHKYKEKRDNVEFYGGNLRRKEGNVNGRGDLQNPPPFEKRSHRGQGRHRKTQVEKREHLQHHVKRRRIFPKGDG